MKVTFRNVEELAAVLLKAQEAHHEFEVDTGKPDAQWALWYANYIMQHNTTNN